MSKGLEKLKTIRHIHDMECGEDESINKDFDIIEKELKALDVIKPLVDLTKGTNHCWLWLGLNGVQITQEQYDLLKEVLL